MDSEKRGTGKRLQHDPLHWENMKDEIFDKVLAEDPGYFKRRRRPLGIIWLAFLGLIAIAIGIFALIPDSGDEKSIDQYAPAIESKSGIIQLESPEQTTTDADLVESNIQDIAVNSDRIESTTLPPAISIKPDSPGSFISGDESGKQGNKQKINHGNADEVNLGDNSPSNLLPQVSVSQREVFLIREIQSLPSMQLQSGKSPYSRHKQTDQWQIAIPIIQTTDPAENPNKSYWRLIGSGGGIISFTKLGGTAKAVALRNEHTSPLFGYEFGLVTEAPLGKNYFISAGLSYRQAYQNIDISTEREVEVVQQNVLVKVTHFVVGSRTTEVFGDTIVTGVEKNRLVYTNNYRWLNIDLGAGRRFTKAQWAFSPSIGGSIGKLWTQGYSVANDGAIIPIEGDDGIYRSESYKLWGGIAVERTISDRFGLFVMYRVDKQLNNASSESEIVFRPWFHRLSLGVVMRL